MNQIIFKASNVHQGHYVMINGKDTGMIVNLYAYNNPYCSDYKRGVDNKIKLLIKNQTR